MLMLYNSDNFAVVQFDLPGDSAAVEPTGNDPALTRGGYEIVDKFARKEIFLEGAMAESFKVGVEALIQTSPSEDELDDYIARFTQLAQNPVVLH
ncbi:DUF3567 domain-containing protein [Aquincola tertiaricarbonis]|uniref:DUF3567 domain-containing protein n=1 Tax=Aquincola tertiaricarbonis TaxID=391953 RepID=A0ABY4SE53_AQUTE|nr:DUF3567 domain-containing protein [Aquincola tertiaricarbonis]URI10008.1 DUF3567 domain-containing protein [Aquincola tertiaricarbonis]